MKAIHEVFVAQFYRRNFLFFLLLVTFLVFVFKPPTLLMSPIFVRPMLEDMRFFSLIMALLLVYFGKCWYETVYMLSEPENRFLHQLGILEPRVLFFQVFKNFCAIMAPGLVYGSIIAGYSLQEGTWHLWPISIGQILIVSAASFHIAFRIYHPQEGKIRPGIQKWLEERFRRSYAFIILQTLIFYHKRTLIITKGIVLMLLASALISHQYDPYSAKAMNLVFLSLGFLECMIAYNLRRTEDKLIFHFRNLPTPAFYRFLAYFLVAMILVIPTLALIMIFGQGNIMVSLLSCGTISMAVFLMGVSVLYYRPLQVYEYLKIVFSAYVVCFFATLYGAPLYILGILAILFVVWIFMEEFYKWNGYVDA